MLVPGRAGRSMGRWAEASHALAKSVSSTLFSYTQGSSCNSSICCPSARFLFVLVAPHLQLCAFHSGSHTTCWTLHVADAVVLHDMHFNIMSLADSQSAFS